MKGRKSGCPANIRDWQVSALDGETGSWVRIKGLKTLTRTVDSETADGSAGTDLWEEPYVTKRSVTVKLSGKAVGCAASGDVDPGQQLLDDYARMAGCMADLTVRFVDPYCHAIEADFIVASAEKEAGESENAVAWELRQVGEAETLPYVPVNAVEMEESEITLRVGESREARFSFAPENASNRRFRVTVNGARVAAVSEIGEERFTVTALAAGTATIDVVSMNGHKTARLTVNAEE